MADTIDLFLYLDRAGYIARPIAGDCTTHYWPTPHGQPELLVRTLIWPDGRVTCGVTLRGRRCCGESDSLHVNGLTPAVVMQRLPEIVARVRGMWAAGV